MTEPAKLVTAAEWQKYLFPFETGDDDIVYANGLELEPVIRDIQRNAELHTLERAARLVGDRANRASQFQRDEIAGWLAQVAYEIKDLIPETPAPTAGGR